jgi:ABC-type phosphate transport system auxiliary subunit
MRDVDDVSSGADVVPAVDSSIPAIQVDISAIDDFVALLRDEVTQNLRPYAEQIIDAHRSGVTFGVTSGSEPMHALRKAYYDCLNSGTNGLKSYIEESEVLLGAAERIAALYRQTDGLAEAKSDDVMAALNVARREIDDRQQDAADLDAQHESDREARRTQR